VKNTVVKLMMAGVLSATMLGCVSQQRADQLETLYRRSQEQVIDLRAQLEEAQARIRALQGSSRTQDPELLARLEQALADRDRLTQALAQAEESLRNAGRGAIALPEDLNQALVQLAESNPNLIEFDQRLGVLRFRSDLTFPLGSVEVNSSAKDSLLKLAEILKSSSASSYEARIVGHTDQVPVTRAETKARHPDNWYLSVHRAIAVMQVLRTGGVPPVRMVVAGNGEFRPVVTAASGKAAEANRRVEIFLVPSTYTGPTGVAAPEQRQAAPARQQQPAAPARPAPTDAPEEFK
jgi:chemotaxis protein MotB